MLSEFPMEKAIRRGPARKFRVVGIRYVVEEAMLVCKSTYNCKERPCGKALGHEIGKTLLLYQEQLPSIGS